MFFYFYYPCIAQHAYPIFPLLLRYCPSSCFTSKPMKTSSYLSYKNFILPLDFYADIHFFFVIICWVKLCNVVFFFLAYIFSHSTFKLFIHIFFDFFIKVWTFIDIDFPTFHPFLILFHPSVLMFRQLFISNYFKPSVVFYFFYFI